MRCMHRNTLMLFEKYAKRYFKDNMKVLEIGPNDHPSSFLKNLNNKSIEWHTLDIQNAVIKSRRNKCTYIIKNVYKFPIKNNTYDIVISGNVIEHVKKIWIWINEITRVCKKGGYVITINPISFPYHESPFDCWRIYPEGMKALYKDAGLKVILSKFESLEEKVLRKHGFRCTYPGPTPLPEAFMSFPEYCKEIFTNYNHPRKNYRSLKLFGKKIIGWPISCMTDTITVGKKNKK